MRKFWLLLFSLLFFSAFSSALSSDIQIVVPDGLVGAELDSYMAKMDLVVSFIVSRTSLFSAFVQNPYDVVGSGGSFGTSVEHGYNHSTVLDVSKGEKVFSMDGYWFNETSGNPRATLFGPNLEWGPCKSVKLNKYYAYIDGTLIGEFGNGASIYDNRFGSSPSSYVGGISLTYDISGFPTGSHKARTTWRLLTDASPECVGKGATIEDFEQEITSSDFAILATSLQPPIIPIPPIVPPATPINVWLLGAVALVVLGGVALVLSGWIR